MMQTNREKIVTGRRSHSLFLFFNSIEMLIYSIKYYFFRWMYPCVAWLWPWWRLLTNVDAICHSSIEIGHSEKRREKNSLSMRGEIEVVAPATIWTLIHVKRNETMTENPFQNGWKITSERKENRRKMWVKRLPTQFLQTKHDDECTTLR